MKLFFALVMRVAVLILGLILVSCDGTEPRDIEWMSPNGENVIKLEPGENARALKLYSLDKAPSVLMKVGVMESVQIEWKSDRVLLIRGSGTASRKYELSPEGNWVSSDPYLYESKNKKYQCSIWRRDDRKHVSVGIIKYISDSGSYVLAQKIDLDAIVPDLTDCAAWSEEGVLTVFGTNGTFAVAKDESGRWVGLEKSP